MMNPKQSPLLNIVIDGDASKLIKVVEDNPSIQEGKVDVYTDIGPVPFNYNPHTGEILK